MLTRSPQSIPGLWRHPDFLRLWAAQTASLVGSQITLLAIPVLAVVTLEASALQMGVLAATGVLPTPLVGLLAGVWTDRLPRRAILITSDIGRAALLATIPVMAVLDLLSFTYLCIVSLLVGTLGTFFEIAHPSLLPTLVHRDQLVDGNSKLEISRSGSLIVGPGLAGALIHLLTAPVAIVLDACTYLISAGLLARIRTGEDRARPIRATRGAWAEAREGLALVRHNRLLASMAMSLAVFNLFSSMINALLVLYAVRQLGLSPAELGLVFAAGSAGFPVGAAAAGWVARRIGVGWAIILGAIVSDLALLLIPLAGAIPGGALSLLIASRVIATLGGPITAINQLSLRQAITPPHLLGRTNATMLVLALALAPIGSLMAGVTADVFGIGLTMVVAAIGVQAGFVVLLVSPIGTIRTLPGSPASLS